jgi:hypothetical protein
VIKSTNFLRYISAILGLFAVFYAVYLLNQVSVNWARVRWVNPSLLLWIFLFAVLNLALEFLKWKRILQHHCILWSRSKMLFTLSRGVLSQFFVPVFFGNLIGRLIDVPSDKRKLLATSILWSNLSQYIPTLFFCFFVFLFFNIQINAISDYRFLLTFMLFLLVAIAVLFYFYGFKLFSRMKLVERYFEFEIPSSLKLRLLIFSVLRYLVFTFQFYLMLNVFEPVSLNIVSLIVVFYGIVTLVPGFVLGKLGVRESVACLVLSGYASNETILITSLLVWVINNLSAMFPSVLIKSPEV